MTRPLISDLFKNGFQNLPKNTQDLFDLPETLNAIDSISESNNLLGFEKEQLAAEIGYVLFGVTKITDFKKALFENLFITEDVAENIDSECYKNIFNKIETVGEKKVDADSLNHQDILSEIENPTPSIASREPAPQIEVKALVEEIKKPTLEQALNGVLPTEGGFSFNENSHPAESIVKKLDEKLSTPTSSLPKEVYVVKKIDPYHEPIE